MKMNVTVEILIKTWVPPTARVQVPESREVPKDSNTDTVCERNLQLKVFSQKLTLKTMTLTPHQFWTK